MSAGGRSVEQKENVKNAKSTAGGRSSALKYANEKI